MSEELDIDSKLVRYFSGTASLKEREEVLNWAKRSGQNQFEFEKIKEAWQNDSEEARLINHEDQKSRIWSAYLGQRKDILKKSVPPMKWILGMAAAFFGIIAVSALLWNSDNPTTVPQNKQVVMLTKKNPIGQKSHIQLPDGSQVWLNAESSIAYPEVFDESHRTVSLQGEAFFEVKQDSMRPFKVEAGQIGVKVLGTEFNFNAYPDNSLWASSSYGQNAKSMKEVVINLGFDNETISEIFARLESTTPFIFVYDKSDPFLYL